MKNFFAKQTKEVSAGTDCEQCGHEMKSDADQCSFCGAPRLQKSMFAWPPIEAAKWAMLGLFVYSIFHLSFYI